MLPDKQAGQKIHFMSLPVLPDKITEYKILFTPWTPYYHEASKTHIEVWQLVLLELQLETQKHYAAFRVKIADQFGYGG
jgi:hypothetical protein